MHYYFKKTAYLDRDGRENNYPSVVIEDSKKYGSFFQAEIHHLSLDYVEEIVGEIEAVLNGEVDFYEGFGFEVYMIECDREKAVVKNVYEDDRVSSYPYRRGLRTDARLARFSTRVLSQPYLTYLTIEIVGYTTSPSQKRSKRSFG